MTITNCPKCGSFNITTAGVCENCGWSPFAQVALCTRITGEMELKVSGKALLDDYKRLLFENRNLTARIAELEAAQRWIPVSEGLPELDQDVFAVVDGELDRGHFYQQWDGEVFFSSDEKGAMMVATHWMPLPDDGEVQE